MILNFKNTTKPTSVLTSRSRIVVAEIGCRRKKGTLPYLCPYHCRPGQMLRVNNPRRRRGAGCFLTAFECRNDRIPHRSREVR